MIHSTRLRKPVAGLLTVLPLVLLWPTLRHLIEIRMLLHMLVEFPVLFAAGWAARDLLLPAATRRLPRTGRVLSLLDWGGLTSASVVTCVVMFWMIPAALDATLLVAPVAAAKYASWWLAGLMLAGSWRRMTPELLLFFVGNLSWTSATAGMLYMDITSRLCANYLTDDQSNTGTGLVLLALVLGALALRQMMRLGAAQEV
ncbi:hypothetical protein SAMN02787142_7858 [Burkholderia sp. WP9]|uniref:hypothetical protein n=1 Tax=Burkholderia sp. WP9 TaxID=1500263 RepID=UPI00089B0975|nr:hypothetical protein [Burkholderia sp. WP9]SEF12568.1 hypothetical protein SAMN02787142_7858 [Burkholderia sp. WP9]